MEFQNKSGEMFPPRKSKIINKNRKSLFPKPIIQRPIFDNTHLKYQEPAHNSTQIDRSIYSNSMRLIRELGPERVDFKKEIKQMENSLNFKKSQMTQMFNKSLMQHYLFLLDFHLKMLRRERHILSNFFAYGAVQ